MKLGSDKVQVLKSVNCHQKKCSAMQTYSNPPNALNVIFKFGIIKAKKGEIVRDKGNNMSNMSNMVNNLSRKSLKNF